MWPWEHVLFAYVFLSVWQRRVYRVPPNDGQVLALVIGSFFPDVIDKPLAWQFGLFDTGWAIAHSIFVAVPVVLALGVFLHARSQPHLGLAFGLGYFLHLLGDVIPASLNRGQLYLEPVLWPIGEPTVSNDPASFGEGVTVLLLEYGTQLVAMSLTAVTVLQLGSVFIGLIAWQLDGRPGLAWRSIPAQLAETMGDTEGADDL